MPNPLDMRRSSALDDVSVIAPEQRDLCVGRYRLQRLVRVASASTWPERGSRTSAWSAPGPSSSVDGAACCLQSGLSCVKIVYADDEAGICSQIEQIDVYPSICDPPGDPAELTWPIVKVNYQDLALSSDINTCRLKCLASRRRVLDEEVNDCLRPLFADEATRRVDIDPCSPGRLTEMGQGARPVLQSHCDVPGHESLFPSLVAKPI